MLIFDQFPSREKAEPFVAAVRRDYGLKGYVYDSQEESDATDYFPFLLTGIIVHIQRTLDSRENYIINEVGSYGGSWAGT